VVRKTALYRYFGFALHEWCAARSDAANQIVFTDIAHRPQHSIDGWDKPSEQLPWQAVRQLTRAGNRFVIPRSRLFYAVDDSLTDSPDGVGLLRHVVELVRRLGVYEGLEGLAYQTDLRGMPSATAPIAELVAAAKSDGAATRDQVQAFVETRLQNLTNLISSYAKTPDQLMYLLLDSAPYLNVDQSTVSQVKKWSLELLKGQSNGVAEVASAIGRVQLEIARVLGIEFVLVGGNDSAGSHGMHSDKTRFFAQNLQTILSEIATFATNDLARTLVGLNGLDPETATPRLVAEPISLEAVLETCQSLSELAKAGLAADDQAIPVLRARMHLPDAPEPTVDAMGLLGRRPGGSPQSPGGAGGFQQPQPLRSQTDGVPGGSIDRPRNLGPTSGVVASRASVTKSKPQPDASDDDDPELDEQELDDLAALMRTYDVDEYVDAGVDKGAGYNPYRQRDGKFAPGPSAAKPKKPEASNVASARAAVDKAKGHVTAVAAKIKESKAAKRAAVTDAKAKIKTATAAAKAAAKNPTKENIQAVKVATIAAAKAKAVVDKHDAAIVAHTSTHAAAKETHASAKNDLKEAKNAAAGKDLSDKEYRDWQNKETDSAHLSIDERAAMTTYSGSHYSDINSALRAGKRPSDWLGGVADRLDFAIAKGRAPRDLVVYRGMTSNEQTVGLKKGSVFRDKAFMSTSASPKVASGFSYNGGVVFHIKIPKGAISIPMTKNGHYEQEREILLPRGTSLRVNSVRKDANGVTHVRARVITAAKG
jgi:hypothetical protein